MYKMSRPQKGGCNIGLLTVKRLIRILYVEKSHFTRFFNFICLFAMYKLNLLEYTRTPSDLVCTF